MYLHVNPLALWSKRGIGIENAGPSGRRPFAERALPIVAKFTMATAVNSSRRPRPRAAQVAMVENFAKKPLIHFAQVTLKTQEYLDALWHEANC
jgi:hypothetical protein